MSIARDEFDVLFICFLVERQTGGNMAATRTNLPGMALKLPRTGFCFDFSEKIGQPGVSQEVVQSLPGHGETVKKGVTLSRFN